MVKYSASQERKSDKQIKQSEKQDMRQNHYVIPQTEVILFCTSSLMETSPGWGFPENPAPARRAGEIPCDTI